MAKNTYKPRDALSLEEAVSRTCSDLGGVEKAATIPGVRVGRTTLFKYGDDSEASAGHVINMDTAAVLTRETLARGGDPHLWHWFNEQVRPFAKPEEVDENALLGIAARLSKEAGEVFADLSSALNPNGPGGKKLTPNERNTLLGDLRDIMRAAESGISMLQGAA